jgi:hypothetical protein
MLEALEASHRELQAALADARDLDDVIGGYARCVRQWLVGSDFGTVGKRRSGRVEWCENGRYWWGIGRDMTVCRDVRKKEKKNKKLRIISITWQWRVRQWLVGSGFGSVGKSRWRRVEWCENGRYWWGIG